MTDTYEAPTVDMVVEADEVEREIHYAGVGTVVIL